jgi:hypothetical protein
MLCLSLLRKSSKIRNPADMESSKIISRFATSSPKFRGFVVLEDSLGGGVHQRGAQSTTGLGISGERLRNRARRGKDPRVGFLSDIP